MRKNLSHIAWIIVLLVTTHKAFTQSAVSVKATVNRNQILIGEPVQLTLEVKVPLGTDISWFPQDSIPHFEFVEKGRIDSLLTNDIKSFRQDIMLTSFDSGTRVIPPLPLVVNGTTYLTDSAVIEVNFSKYDPNKDYHDIKDIVDIQNPYAKYIPWMVAGITLLSLALVVYFVRKRKVEQTVVKEQVFSKLSPYEEALKSLAELKKQKLAENGQVKLYYTRLNDILRLFMLRKLQVASMVKTNDELIMQLRQLNISKEQFSQLAQALRMSDFVKFAKYLPDEKNNEENFSIIQSSVELLNTIEK
jgi:hypothetical protein